jgi:hypothetical protein
MNVLGFALCCSSVCTMATIKIECSTGSGNLMSLFEGRDMLTELFGVWILNSFWKPVRKANPTLSSRARGVLRHRSSFAN